MARYKVYFVNIWDELMSERGLRLLEQRCILRGNWLSGRRWSSLGVFKPDIIIYAPTSSEKGLNLPPEYLKTTPTILWILYPDYILGWNFKKQQFKYHIPNNLKQQFKAAKLLLTNSLYTKQNLEKILPYSVFNFKNCYLGIDTKGIRSFSKQNPWSHNNLSVLWNHMWRIDKNFHGALEIIKNLAAKYKNVNFYIGRKEQWGNKKYSPPWLIKKYKKIRKWILKNSVNNIFFVKTMSHINYFKFLNKMDIAFSVSYQETFGISMLEQAAAGLACIVPNKLVYPEIFKNYPGLVARTNIIQEIKSVIENPSKMIQFQLNTSLLAESFDIEKTINQLLKFIESILKKRY